jgi:hypothetical protein
VVTAPVKGVAFPILLRCPYAASNLYVLTVPDNFADLYHLPPEVLDKLRAVIGGDLPARLEGPSQIGLFLYDNDKLIVESFAAPGDKPVAARVVLDKKFTRLVDLLSGKQTSGRPRGDKTVFDLTLPPASYAPLAAE